MRATVSLLPCALACLLAGCPSSGHPHRSAKDGGPPSPDLGPTEDGPAQQAPDLSAPPPAQLPVALTAQTVERVGHLQGNKATTGKAFYVFEATVENQGPSELSVDYSNFSLITGAKLRVESASASLLVANRCDGAQKVLPTATRVCRFAVELALHEQLDRVRFSSADGRFVEAPVDNLSAGGPTCAAAAGVYDDACYQCVNDQCNAGVIALVGNCTQAELTCIFPSHPPTCGTYCSCKETCLMTPTCLDALGEWEVDVVACTQSTCATACP